MAEIHLGLNTEVQITPNVTHISPPSDMTGTDQIKHTLSCLDQ